VTQTVRESIYRIELQALPDPAPATVRLRRALKTLLRAFRLRCRSVEEVLATAGCENERRTAASTEDP
jgi:hypothetical protein